MRVNSGRSDFPRDDKEVYTAQLNKLEHDHKEGKLSDTEAKVGRTHIARRLLASARVVENDIAARFSKKLRDIILVTTVILVPVVSFGLYIAVGQPNLVDQRFIMHPKDETQAGSANSNNFEVMAQSLLQQLQVESKNARGWAMLARYYINLGKYEKAVLSAERAVNIDSRDIEAHSIYGETFYFAAGKRFTPNVRSTFLSVLEKEPTEPRARYYLALADAADGNEPKAYAAIQTLIDESPIDAPYLPILLYSADTIAEKIGLKPILSAQAGHLIGELLKSSPAWWITKQDFGAATLVSKADQNQLVRYMVGRLEQKLRKNQDDLDSWVKAANAYRMLGEVSKEEASLRRAAQLAPKNVEILLHYGRTLRRVSENKQTKESVAVMRQVLAVDPDNLEALFLLGRAEASAGRIGIGKDLMMKALRKLPENSKEYIELKKQIEAVSE